MTFTARARNGTASESSGLAADLAERFANIPEPVLRHRHDGVVTAARILGPADDVVAGFPVPADGDVAILEDGDGGGHAGVGFCCPGAGIVGVLVVKADAGRRRV